MSVFCCGVQRTTPFCPMCGKHLRDDEFGEMIDYFIVRIKSVESQLRTKEQGHGTIGSAEAKKALAEKYRKWIAALAKARGESS